jgi:Fe-S-cluster-containing hydrogenase component 2
VKRGLMIIHYGYSDGSGEYYISVDSEKCNGCGKCIENCPQRALELGSIMVDLEEKLVVTVAENHRREIKYTCSSCKPESKKAPCVLACDTEAIRCTWRTRRGNITT